MKIFAGVKGKVMIGAMAFGLLTTGAFAGASNPTFTDHVQSKINTLIGKAAGWAGYTVATNAENQEDAVETYVQDQFNGAKTSVSNDFATKTAEGNRLVNEYATGYKAEVKDVADAAKLKASTDIQTAVTTEVDEAKSEIDAAAKAKADALLAANNVGSAPAHPER